ncbi:class I SAM-dependent methyltransferase [Neobacillus massiliamazoniensis]|uniref:S-adenosyl-L-methionine-dependent methyltransferase n=1 Tax=Neobacillus massiliamazoniensis TaxID=1499688 RepID=A0A0U1P4K1_9BACI|nr:class I SAM-dependent methyltransferase [Neobacillus massiliamazoniensis]CRK85156.1 O-methyltransferase [Neobacillus massiliamazoniensis]
MEKTKQSLTALVSCFARGYHVANSSQPVFNDHLAHSLLREDEKQLIAANWANAIAFFDQEKSEVLKTFAEKLDWVMNTQTIPQLVSRSRYAEDGLMSAVKRGIKQYVILGAGLDTFALRQENLPEDFIIFEVDHPATQTFKINRLHEMGIAVPPNLKFVPVDFKNDSLQNELKKSGFDGQKYAYFSLLGVVMYLEKKDFYQLLSTISALSVNGSSFVFDYLDDTAFNDTTASQKLIQMRQITAQTGEPIITGFDPFELDLELQDCNMLLYENLSPANIEEMYFANREDELHAFDHFHFAHLVVNKR